MKKAALTSFTTMLVLSLFIGVNGFFLRVGRADGSWLWVRDTVTGYYGEAVVGTGDAIYIARRESFYRYDPTDKNWVALADPPNPDSGDAFKTGTALAWDQNDYIYALYGAAGTDSRRWFYRYSISNDSWRALANSTFDQGEGDSVAWVGSENRVYATVGGEQRPTYFMRYDPSTNNWSDQPATPPAGMGDGASLVWTGSDHLYALRGEFQETEALHDYWRYSLTNNSWTAMADIPALPHSGGSGGVGDGGSLLYVGWWLPNHTDYVYALSGNQAHPDNIPDNRTYRYTISIDSWERLADLPFGVGYYVGCRLGYADGSIYAWQGTPSTWTGGGNDLAKYEFPRSHTGTAVSGIIWENTTWTLENSPYIITDTVQIPRNVTLILEPGVTVTRPTSGDMFLIHGKVFAQGTVNAKIVFNGGGNSDFFTKGYGEDASMLLEYCVIRNGNSFGWHVPEFSLEYSELSDLAAPSRVWFPKEDIHIEHNIFINVSGFVTGTRNDVNVYIRYNLFKGKNPHSSADFCIQSQTSYDSSETVVRHNSFIDMDGIVLKLAAIPERVAMSATENYWGTLDTDVIDSMIYDRNDNIECGSYIEYLPILTEPHPATPIMLEDVKMSIDGIFRKDDHDKWRCYANITIKNNSHRNVTIHWIYVNAINVTFVDETFEELDISGNETLNCVIQPEQEVSIGWTVTESGFTKEPKNLWMLSRTPITEAYRTITVTRMVPEVQSTLTLLFLLVATSIIAILTRKRRTNQTP